MQDKRLSTIVLLLVTLFALTTITGCIVRAIIAPPSIALIAPADGATDQPTTLVLTWEATPGVSKNKKIPAEIVGYRFYIALSNEDYGDGEPTEDKQAEPKGLEYDTVYKWKVEAIQSDNQIGKSEESTFTTEKKQYAAPEIELTSPESGATDLATTVTLTWEATPGAQTNAGVREGVSITEYRVYHKKTGDPYSTEPATTTEKSYNLTNLEYAATYTWYVVALQSDGKRATSTESTFTTQAVQYDIPEITLKSPGKGVGSQPTTVNLTWEATPGKQTNVSERAPTIEGYLVYFGVNDQKYGDPVPVTATQTTKRGLDYDTTYKWQVVALQSDGKRATSTEWTFTTLAPGYGPPTIELTSPDNRKTDLATPVRLEWVAAPGAQTNVGERAPYLLGFQVHYQKEGGTKVSNETGNQYYDLIDLDPDATYTWQVVALQSDRQRATSTEWTFKTGKRIKRYSSSGDLKGKYDKLSDAINEADNEDHIVVVGGTILNNETQQVTIDGTEVTILSSDPGNPFIIDMGGGGSTPGSKRENSRVFHITNGASVTIRDAIIKGGDATDEEGGGIRITAGSTVTAINATITDNTARWGGGVSVEDSTFNAYGTTITGNTAKAEGYGVEAHGGGVAVLDEGAFNAYAGTKITDNTAKAEGEVASAWGGGVAVYDGVFSAYEGTTITDNKAEAEKGEWSGAYGGGVTVWNGEFIATETTIASNTAEAKGYDAWASGGGVDVFGYEGEGIFNAYAGTKITGNTAKVEDDYASAYGGGVAVENGTFNAFEDTKITDNTAKVEGDYARAYGGGVAVGVAVLEYGTFNATATTITGNTAKVEGDYARVEGGGVAVLEFGTFNATATTITGNTAEVESEAAWVEGGGVAVLGGTLNAESVEISGNTALMGGGIFWNVYQGNIKTNYQVWNPQEDQNEAFSVKENGEIKTGTEYSVSHPVQVFDNDASEGKQMKVNQ